MEKFMAVLEKFLVPIAVKLSSQRHMMSVKDAFIAMMPVTLVGSMSVLFNVFVRDLPTAIWGAENAITESMSWLIAINGAVWWGTLAMMALIFAFSLGYNLAKNSGVDPLPAAIVALSVFVVTIPQAIMVPEGVTAVDATGAAVTSIWGALPNAYISATGLFTAMIMVLLMMEIYVRLIKANVTIKMPEQVPANVSSAFTAFIPAMVAIFLSAAIAYVVMLVTGTSINDWISTFIMAPLMQLSQGYFSIMLVTFFTQILWFFGIHGMQVLTPVYESIWGVAQIANMDAYALQETIPYMWTRASFDLYGMFGGSGATIGLIVSMFVFGRREETKAMRNIAGAPGIFNINEPLSFGLPIILNPIYFIPWLLIPMVTMTVGYVATISGFADPVIAAIPWVTPIGLSAFLATGGSIGALITQIVCVIISIVMWAPFLIASERQADKQYGSEKE